jgi:hypothetical protein
MEATCSSETLVDFQRTPVRLLVGSACVCALTIAKHSNGEHGTGAGRSYSFFGSPQIVFILPLLCTHLSLPSEVCDNLDQAAHYHILDL